MQKEKLEMEEREKEKERQIQREKLEMEERIQKEKLEQAEKEKEREYNLRMKELEMQDKAKTKPLDLGTHFDVTKHIRLVPPFQEKEVDKYFLHFEKVAENLKWPNEHRTLLLQSVVIGLNRVQIMTKLKNLFLRLMSYSLRPIGRNLGIAEKKMIRRMLNLLEQKNNYLTDDALQRK